MIASECKKCHKPLRGNKCDTCKQKEKDKIKSIVKVSMTVVGGVVIVGGKALSIVFNKNKS